MSWSLTASQTKIKNKVDFYLLCKALTKKNKNLLTGNCLSVALFFTPSGFQPLIVSGTVPVPVAFNVTEYTL
jgi:hypothetical protein